MADEEKQTSKEEFESRFNAWLDQTATLYDRWQSQENLTEEECQERFWGRSLIEAWKKL